MLRDEVIEEVWRNRDAYAAEHGYDLDRMVADLERRQAARRDAQVVDLRRLRAEQAEASRQAG